jgi:hypothetical protein
LLLPGNLVTFRVLEPYAVKVASTVLRRERRGNPPALSDHYSDFQIQFKKAKHNANKNGNNVPNTGIMFIFVFRLEIDGENICKKYFETVLGKTSGF